MVAAPLFFSIPFTAPLRPPGQRPMDFSTPEFALYYTYEEGPQKDERLVVIQEK